jgi:hypothetical protein
MLRPLSSVHGPHNLSLVLIPEMPTFRPLLLADARAPLEASVEELSQVKGFEQTIVEAANALMILHSILGELEVRALSTHLQDPRSN